jgi:hypothetical protein
MEQDFALQEKYATILPHLNEKQQRLYVASESQSLGWGGITKVYRASGISRSRIYRGIVELNANIPPTSRCRVAGGGRKRLVEQQPEILKELDSIIDPETRGDPETPLRWTTQSTRSLAINLIQKGYQISHTLISELLRSKGYSLQGNRKTDEGKVHEDRDKQFRYIHDLSKQYLADSYPVISVDCKKKELIGNYQNKGKVFRPKGKPEEVKVYDFVDKNLGKALPYGIYDVLRNQGFVNVGIDHDTAAFAVNSIRKWWTAIGKEQYLKTTQMMITADSGGSNGRRVKLWKKELQSLANETGLNITVCHFPPGTSKWNKIEHRLFSQISINWRGKPLRNIDIILKLIGATHTRTGLTVTASLDSNRYELKRKVSNKEMQELNINHHLFHGEWNYTLHPQKS